MAGRDLHLASFVVALGGSGVARQGGRGRVGWGVQGARGKGELGGGRGSWEEEGGDHSKDQSSALQIFPVSLSLYLFGLPISSSDEVFTMELLCEKCWMTSSR